MRKAYRVLAYLVAAGVALQAAAIAYAMFGLTKWIERGGTLDQSTELTPALDGYTGFQLTEYEKVFPSAEAVSVSSLD